MAKLKLAGELLLILALGASCYAVGLAFSYDAGLQLEEIPAVIVPLAVTVGPEGIIATLRSIASINKRGQMSALGRKQTLHVGWMLTSGTST